jgi:hypothetical protein
LPDPGAGPVPAVELHDDEVKYTFGVSKAHDHPADMWLQVSSAPRLSYHFICTSTGICSAK